MKKIKLAVFVFWVLAGSLRHGFGQTNLSFNGVNATQEGAIRLSWDSTSNEVYEIDYADSLIDTNTGTVTWNTLYDNYPSQGTNTFWLDTGNYNLVPQVVHPKYMPTRFYRIVNLGLDSLTDEPTVTVDSLTNNTTASGELTFTVTAATDQPGLHGTILYVDGQEMQTPDSTTNYTTGSTNYETDTYSINTCEWLNGNHTIFATTEVTSQYSSQQNGGAILTGHGVSPFVSVLFNNLVEGISFSQPSFDPSSGQTQQVSAVFALDSDWTLDIVDVFTNIVLSTNGSGTSMSFGWDGNGTGGTNLPSGLYYYYITATTNGLTPAGVGGGGGTGGGSPPSPDFESESSELWLASLDTESVAPLRLYPPGFDTNGFTVFSATSSEVRSLMAPSLSSASSFTSNGAGFSLNGAGSPANPPPNPQPAPPSPQRPPSNPIRGLAGTIGVVADTYGGSGTNGPTCPSLDNGSHTGLKIQMQGSTAPRTNPPRPEHKAELLAFVKGMALAGWSNPLYKVDTNLNISDLRGSGTPLNNVNMGVLLAHGTYGTSPDFAANQCMQMYIAITGGGTAQWLRFSEMNLGGTGTNGLKWMVMDQCFGMYHVNWSSMQNLGVKPYNSNMHMIMGGDTVTWTSTAKWANFAKYMNFGTGKAYNPLTIKNAYYQANMDAFKNAALPSGTVIKLAVAGDSACLADTVKTNSTPGGTWSYGSMQVYP